MVTKKIILLLLILATGLQAAEPAVYGKLKKPGTQISVWSSSGGLTVYRRGAFFENFEVKYKGDILFADDDMTVTFMKKNAYLSISQRTMLKTRKVIFEPGPDGTVIRTYFEGAFQEDVHPGANAWIRESVLEAIHTSGVGAVGRVGRLIETKGPDAVLDELSDVTSNRVRRIYIEVVLASDITEETAVRTVEAIGKYITSSNAKAESIILAADKFLNSDSYTGELFESASRISSSHELSRTIQELAKKREINTAVAEPAAAAAGHISSSNEKANAVIALAIPMARANADFTGLLKTVAVISSSSEKGRAIKAIARIENLPPDIYPILVEAAGTISSSHETSGALAVISHEATATDEFVTAFIAATVKISSSFEKAVTLINLAKMDGLSLQNEKDLILALASLSSSYEMARVLTESLELLKNHDAVVDEYLKIVDRISSSSEQERALLVFLQEENLTKETLRKVVDTARSISSSSARDNVMAKIIDRL